APDVGPLTCTLIAEEARADDLEPSPSSIDGAAPVVGLLVLGVPVDKGQVLHGEAGVVLVVAVRRRVALLLVAGIHVENSRLAAAVERHLAAAVERHDRIRSVSHLGRLVHRDGDWLRTTIEDNHAASSDGF